VEKKVVTYCPDERPGAALEKIRYDYLVISLGARLAYDKIKGFGEYGSTVSDSVYGNRLRDVLFEGGYKGGPVATGSDLFHQGTQGKPSWIPMSPGACEGPPLEIGLTMAHWLEQRKMGGPSKVTFFTPGEMIAEDAGTQIVHEFLDMAGKMGFGYKNNTKGIAEITKDGIIFQNGEQLEAELKIIMPDWVPHPFIKELPITDEVGFVLTDLNMRNPDHPEIFASGDAAALTVPKLGALGHLQADIIGKQIAKDLKKMKPEQADQPYKPQIICFGDMGDHKGFYIHSDTWFGGKTSVFRMGYLYYAMKIAFKEMYFRTGGMPPNWGIPAAELVADRVG
jgi:sulfide:quinone oxidoreductase